METSKRWGPKWLRKLTRESWQAELIISGAAIIGSLQLPGLLEKFQHYLLLGYGRDVLFYWFFANIYWAIFVYGLILLFIGHFITRALWIGLLGLKSVYPKGVVRTTVLSDDYQDKMAKEWGDLDGYIQRVDRTASSLFGLGFMTAGQFFNLGLIFSGMVFLLGILLWLGVPNFWALVIVLTPVALLFIASSFSGVLTKENLRDKEWVKRYHYPLARGLTRLTNPVNFQFYGHAAALWSTNHIAEKKIEAITVKGVLTTLMVMVGFGLLLGVLFGMTDTFKDEFFDHTYHRAGNDSISIDPANYAGGVTDELLYEPLINSMYISPGEPLWVWVPMPERELKVLQNQCSAPAVADSLSIRNKRSAKRARALTCASEYIDLYLDDEPLAFPGAMRRFLSSAGMEQLGFHLELSQLDLDLGRHTLKIVTHYSLEADKPDEDFRTTYISFYVVDSGHTLSERNPTKRSLSAPEN